MASDSADWSQSLRPVSPNQASAAVRRRRRAGDPEAVAAVGPAASLPVLTAVASVEHSIDVLREHLARAHGNLAGLTTLVERLVEQQTTILQRIDALTAQGASPPVAAPRPGPAAKPAPAKNPIPRAKRSGAPETGAGRRRAPAVNE